MDLVDAGLILREGEGASLRLGVVTSKKVSNRAVDRNRARRILRALFREHRAEFGGGPTLSGGSGAAGVDVVIIARRNILSAAHGDIETELLRLARKAGLLRKKPRNVEQGISNHEGG